MFLLNSYPARRTKNVTRWVTSCRFDSYFINFRKIKENTKYHNILPFIALTSITNYSKFKYFYLIIYTKRMLLKNKMGAKKTDKFNNKIISCE